MPKDKMPAERPFDDRSPYTAALAVRAALMQLSDHLKTEEAVMDAVVEAQGPGSQLYVEAIARTRHSIFYHQLQNLYEFGQNRVPPSAREGFCAACGRAQYPDREVCGQCLGGELGPQVVDGAGELLSWTRLHASLEPVFRDRLPWLVASVRLRAGPVVLAHWAGAEPVIGQPVQVAMLRDPADREVLVAIAAGGEWPDAAAVFGTGS